MERWLRRLQFFVIVASFLFSGDGDGEKSLLVRRHRPTYYVMQAVVLVPVV